MLQLPGGSESQQVMLQVRVAEVNRRAVQELGVNFFSTRPDATGPGDDAAVLGARLRRRQDGGLVFSDFLNLFFFNRKEGLGVVDQGARAEGPLPVARRAEPDRLQRPGGELPRRRRVPGAGRAGRDAATVTIMFKEFGVRLNFKPTIAGDVIRLKVRPEVSSLDFNNGITLAGLPRCRRSSRAAPRPTWSCATGSRSRSRAC